MARIVLLSKGGNIGGSQRQLLYLVTNLDRSYDPVVLCTTEGEIVCRLRSAGVATEVLGMRPWRKLPNVAGRYVDARRLVASIRRLRPALVHSSDLWLGNYLAWVRAKTALPSITHVRGPVGPHDIRKHRLCRATGLISISTKITRALIHAGISPTSVVQIEDAVDIGLFRPRREAPKASFPAPLIHVGLVGRVEPAKHQMEFVAAAARAAAALPGRFRFSLIGEMRDEGYYARLRSFADLQGLNGQLCFAGRKDDMPDVLSSLDLLVSLSGGSVMYEAMSCGVCVLSAGFTNAGDAVFLRDGVTGVVLPSRDQAAVADALTYLAQHPEVRSRLGAAARECAENRFSHVRMAERTMEFYDRILSGRC